MRCETSFFSLTLYKKHLKRYWPLWAAWLGLWTLIMPMQAWNMGVIYRAHNEMRELREYFERMPLEAMNVLFSLLAVLAAMVAAAVLFHLFKGPAANFIGALPMRREGVFATALAAGYTMMVGPLLVVSLLLLAVEAALGTVVPGPVFAFLGAGALNSFFWLCFATLCCVISGHAVAGVVFYGIFNFIVPVMTTLVEGLLSGFLYGFAGFSDGFYEVSNWLCPMAKLSRHRWYEQMDWEMLAIYAAVGFLMLLASIGLHHIRKAERAGDLIAFDPVKWLFKLCVTVCGGIGFGTFFTIVIFNSVDLTEGWKFGVCCAVAAFLCYMVAEMLLAKSFKVWKHWKGAAVSAVAFLLVVAAVDMDWIGFTTRIPAPESVKRATVYFSGTDMSSTASNGLDFTGEDVKTVTGLHRYLVERRDGDEDYNKNKYLSVRIRYDLGWTSIQRKYATRYDAGDALSQTLDGALRVGKASFPSERGTPSELYGELEVPVKATDPQVTHGPGGDAEAQETTEFVGVTVQSEDIRAVWEAVRQDAEAGRLTPLLTGETGKRPQGTLHAYWNMGERSYRYQTDLHEGMTATWNALKERGYLTMLEN